MQRWNGGWRNVDQPKSQRTWECQSPFNNVYNSLEVLYTPMLDEFLSIWHKKLSWYRIQQKVKCLNFIEGYFSSFA